MGLTAKIDTRVIATLTNPLDLSIPSDPVDLAKRITLLTGTASGQADMSWHDRRTLTPAGTENLDLAGGLTNAFGVTQTFARIKLVLVLADATNVNKVNVIRETTNGVPLFLALGDGVPVHPGGLYLWAAPKDGELVTGGTGDLLTLTNAGGGTSVTFDIVIIGASA